MNKDVKPKRPSASISFDDYDLAQLLDKGATERLVEELIDQVFDDISLDIKGNQITAHCCDFSNYETVTKKSLLGILIANLDENIDGKGIVRGPQAYLDRIKATLAVLETSIVRYREAVANWVVEEWTHLDDDTKQETANPSSTHPR